VTARAAASTSKANEQDLLNAMTMQRIEGKVDAMIKSIGWESTDERGEPIGTGIVGRLMRSEHRQVAFEKKVEARFTIQSGWIRYAAGAMAAAAIFIGVIWWIIGDKVEHVVK
jgi:hypothetical protein